MSREDVLRKIRGLLAIAARSNFEAEAQTAMAAAQRLMLEHDISEVQVEQSARRYDDEQFQDTFARRPPEDLFVAPLLDRFFFVRCGWGHEQDARGFFTRIVRRVFGEEHHRAIAKFVWVYLSRTFRACWNARVAERGRRFAGKRSLYYRGLHDGLCRRLSAERSQQFAHAEGLIRARQADLQSAFGSAFPLSREVKPRDLKVGQISLADMQAWQDGRQRGETITIPTAIGTAQTSEPKRLEVAR